VILSSGYDEQEASACSWAKHLAGFLPKALSPRGMLMEKMREILGWGRRFACPVVSQNRSTWMKRNILIRMSRQTLLPICLAAAAVVGYWVNENEPGRSGLHSRFEMRTYYTNEESSMTSTLVSATTPLDFQEARNDNVVIGCHKKDRNACLYHRA